MEQIENQKIKIEKNGQEVECDLLFTFDSPDTGRAYMVYTDHTKDAEGRNTLYIMYYDPVLEKIGEVTNEKELEMVNKVIEQIRDEINE